MSVWRTNCQPDWIELDVVAGSGWISDLFVCTPYSESFIEYDMLTVHRAALYTNNRYVCIHVYPKVVEIGY